MQPMLLKRRLKILESDFSFTMPLPKSLPLLSR